MIARTPKKALLAMLVPAIMCHHAYADDMPTPQVELEHEHINLKKPKTDVGESVVTRRELTTQNIQNTHDLVRYHTEVDVAEVGRYGNKGFAIRGVDGNRVAMDLDGVALPTIEANELFSPYGYIYEGRFNPDVEVLGNIRIMTGANSVISGSGAVGGAVSFNTKEPISMIKEGNLGGYAKVGFTNKNEETLFAVGLAGVYDKNEFLLNYARRQGHELKNHDMHRHDANRMSLAYDFANHGEMGRASQPSSTFYPDAVDYERDAFLLKGYHHLSDTVRVGISAFYQKQNTDSYAWSKSVSGQWRVPHDKEETKGFGLHYHYTPNHSKFIDNIALNYQIQDVLGLADTFLHQPDRSNPRLSQREYRPTQTNTKHLDVSTTLLPKDLGKFGTHTFSAKLGFNHQDYKSTFVRLNYDQAGNITQAIQPYAIVMPDAKKDNLNLIFSNAIDVNERVKAGLGIRYDYHKYNPYFQDDVYFGDIRSSEQNEINSNVDKSWVRTKFYQDYRSGVYDRQPSFNKLTYSGRLDYQIIPDKLATRYKISTGFLAPTVTQMYSAFQGFGVKQIINPNLRPETSLNHELEFEYQPNPTTKLTLGGYLSKYDDFIHTTYWQASQSLGYRGEDKYGCGNHEGTCTMSHNLDEATIKGVKFGIESDLSDKLNLRGRLGVFANFHTSWDSAIINTDHNGKMKINTLAAIPANLILGADYYSPNDDWSLHGRVRGIMRKNPKDTKYIASKDIEEVTTRLQECPEDLKWYGWCEIYGYQNDGTGKYTRLTTSKTITGYEEYVDTYQHAHHGRNVWLFDVYGTKKFGKNQNIILNAGIYNLTDARYIPWETLRQFNNLTANNMVDSQGYGLNRYTAPGRNYALSLTYEF